MAHSSSSSPCIEYPGKARDHRGYGRMTVKGKSWAAHRWAWTQVHGPIPEGVMVLHSCDNRACWNVEHLFLGTAQDNTDDMMQKGRHRVAPSERNGSAKLTWSKVTVIRAQAAAGRSYRSLARAYGVDHKTIRSLVLGHTWKVVSHGT